MKKCFVRAFNLCGGAPKSLFEYLMVLKNQGYYIQVVAASGEKEIEQLYVNTFDEVILEPCYEDLYWGKKIFELYRQQKKEYSSLDTFKPDLVIALGAMNILYYSHFTNRLQLPFVGIIAGGDLSLLSETVKLWAPCKVICFSKENELVIQKSNAYIKSYVVSNRIRLKEAPFTTDIYKTSHDMVEMLLVSRLDDDKFNSINNTIDMIAKLNLSCDTNLSILGGGSRYNDLEALINKNSNKKNSIRLLGHQNDLYPFFKEAQIVFGKGRSVLEPIMLNRVGIVIGDDGEFAICSQNSLQNLYCYNFSGRDIEYKASIDDISKLICDISEGAFGENSIDYLRGQISRLYSADYLCENFTRVLNDADVTLKYYRKDIVIIQHLLAGIKQKFVLRSKENG